MFTFKYVGFRAHEQLEGCETGKLRKGPDGQELDGAWLACLNRAVMGLNRNMSMSPPPTPQAGGSVFSFNRVDIESCICPLQQAEIMQLIKVTALLGQVAIANNKHAIDKINKKKTVCFISARLPVKNYRLFYILGRFQDP
jgi:hypothetical protein